MHLIGWVRLMEFVQVMNRIPISYQKKAYFEKVLEWHVFHQGVAGKSEQEVREGLDGAIRAGMSRRERPRRKRKKRLRNRGKAPDFS